MAFFKRKEKRSLENPATPLSNPAAWLVDLFGGGKSTAGVSVTTENALELPAVFACVNVISETIASLPLHIYKSENEGSEKATSLPLYSLLHDAPNKSGLTSFRWRRLVMRHLLLHGRHYSRIERDGGNRIVGIYPLNPKKITVERRKGELEYTYELQSGKSETLKSDEILHFTGLDDDDGIDGVSPIEKVKNAIGLGMALEEFGAKFFKNGARPGMVMEFPDKLSPEAIARLKKSVEDTHGGVGNSHKLLVMENGGKLHTISVDPEKSQYLEGRKFQNEEISRIFRVPPIFLQNLDRATYSNNEQQDLHFVKHTLRPWLVMLEQEMNLKLLGAGQRKKYNIEFNVDGLLRGDFKNRTEALVRGIQGGLLTPNEARAKENLPAHTGDAEKLHIQGATVPLGTQPNHEDKDDQGN